MKPRILFVSHDATRTGAPILLLNLAKVLSSHYEIEFLLKNGGDLTEDFKIVGKTYMVERPWERYKQLKFISKILRRVSSVSYKKLNLKPYELIISNTLTNGDIIKGLKKNFNGAILSYVHELEMAASYFTNKTNLKHVLSYSSGYLVPSQAVKEYLINNLRVKAEDIDILQYYIPPADTISGSSVTKAQRFTVGGIGTSDWRKSPDLFIIVAKLLFEKRPDANIRFVWKGAAPFGIEIERLNYDIKKAGLQNRVVFLASSSSVNDFYAEIDVLLLTSREDPYPLVVLEAANFNHPTICFAGAGGAPEFVNAAGAGHVSPYLNLNNMVEKILYYYDNTVIMTSEGGRAKQHLTSTHQNSNYILEQFVSAVNYLNKYD